MERRHQRLLVWQDGISLVESVYRVTALFPSEEKFGLTAQMRRAAISVPSNIAEGATRRSRREYLQFLAIARGSLSELDTQIVIARRLRYLGADEDLDELVQRVFAKLGALINSLSQREQS